MSENTGARIRHFVETHRQRWREAAELHRHHEQTRDDRRRELKSWFDRFSSEPRAVIDRAVAVVGQDMCDGYRLEVVPLRAQDPDCFTKPGCCCLLHIPSAEESAAYAPPAMTFIPVPERRTEVVSACGLIRTVIDEEVFDEDRVIELLEAFVEESLKADKSCERRKIL